MEEKYKEKQRHGIQGAGLWGWLCASYRSQAFPSTVSFCLLQTQGQFPHWSIRHFVPSPSSAFLPLLLSFSTPCPGPLSLSPFLFLSFPFPLFLSPHFLCLLPSVNAQRILCLGDSAQKVRRGHFVLWIIMEPGPAGTRLEFLQAAKVTELALGKTIQTHTDASTCRKHIKHAHQFQPCFGQHAFGSWLKGSMSGLIRMIRLRGVSNDHNQIQKSLTSCAWQTNNPHVVG